MTEMLEMLTLPTTANASESGKSAARRTAPLFVPRGQLYYWSNPWQTGENDALRDLAEGRFRTFPNGSAAAAWLLSDEE
jgi:hypothetical protein